MKHGVYVAFRDFEDKPTGEILLAHSAEDAQLLADHIFKIGYATLIPPDGAPVAVAPGMRARAFRVPLHRIAILTIVDIEEPAP